MTSSTVNARGFSLGYFGIMFLLGVSSAAAGTTLTYFAARHSIPIEQAGVYITLHTVGSMLGTLIMGRMLDRIPTRTICAIGLGALVCGLIGVHVAGSVVALLASAAVLGFGFGTLLIGGAVIIARLNPNNPAPMLNLLNVSFSIGGIVGPQIVGVIIGVGSASLIYVLLAGITALIAPLLVLWNVHPPKWERAGESNGSLGRLILRALPFAVFLFLYTGAELGFSSWIYTQLNVVTGLPDDQATAGVSLFWLGITVGRIIAAGIASRVRGEIVLVAASTVMAAGALLLLAFSSDAGISLAATAMVGLGAAPIFPTTIALVNRTFTSSGGTISGALITCGSFGIAVIPYVQGLVGGGVNGGIGVTLFLALTLIGLAVFALPRVTAKPA